MSKLFIYSSQYGSGDTVASYLKDKGFEIRKVESTYKLSKVFFFAMMKGGYHAGINKVAKLVNYDNNVAKYDEIYIGSPIWNDRLTPITNAILEETFLKDKKLTFILYSGGGQCKHAYKKLHSLYKDATIINLKQPKKYPEELKKLD